MVRRTLPFLFLLSCSKGPEADLQYIGQARSLAAEWALVNQAAADGRLNATYTDTIRQELREQLQTTAKSLTQADSAYGQEIRALLAEPPTAPANELRAHSVKLKQIEDRLESA